MQLTLSNFPQFVPRGGEGGGAVLLLALPGHNGRDFGAAGLGREGGGDLNGGAAVAGVELVEALHEGTGLGVDEFGGFLEKT